MRKIPELSKKDLLVLKDLRTKSAVAFYSNVTNFLISEMEDYIKDARCWRLAIMGETRGGKSETGQTCAVIYRSIFNKYLKAGRFDTQDIFIDGTFKKSEIDLTINHICSNQGNYIFTLRRAYKEGWIKFGQIWIIDEHRKSIGGIGSYSEMIDLKNVNNIIAKFMQAEIWIQPLQFETNNTPYGLYIYKKDIDERINWCLLYKIQRNAIGGVEFNFMGWVSLPLHEDVKLREAYNMKKNLWIKQEMEGTVDERVIERKKTARELSEDPDFSLRTVSGKTFKLSKSQQVTVLEDWIISKKTQNWNQVEKEMIIEEARKIAETKYIREEGAKQNGKSNS
jgi:hypothetical protein